MVNLVNCFYLITLLLGVNGKPKNNVEKMSHIEVNVRPVYKNVFSKTVTHSNYARYRFQGNNHGLGSNENEARLFAAFSQLLQNIKNNLSTLPINSQYFNFPISNPSLPTFRIYIYPKNIHETKHDSTNDQRPELNPSTQKEPEIITTEQAVVNDEDDDDTNRPIVLLDMKSPTLENGILRTRIMPDVEHGSVQDGV